MTEQTPGPAARELAGVIDHTLLAPDASREDVLRVAAEAVRHGFKSVCVNPLWVATVARELAGTGVLACSVVGFPFGATTPQAKAFEAAGAVRDGAAEVDMVIDIAAARRGDRAALVADVAAVAEAVHGGGALLKVIIETALLDDAAKVLACEAAVEAGADFVKTSTGFAGGGATAADVALMRRTVGPDVGVKASGGVRTAADARAMLEAGASRLGASASVDIVGGGSAAADHGY